MQTDVWLDDEVFRRADVPASRIVDELTMPRASDLSLGLNAALRGHSASDVLGALGDLAETGSTGRTIDDPVMLALA